MASIVITTEEGLEYKEYISKEDYDKLYETTSSEEALNMVYDFLGTEPDDLEKVLLPTKGIEIYF